MPAGGRTFDRKKVFHFHKRDLDGNKIGETIIKKPRGRPRLVETRPSVEVDVPLGQASLYKAPLQQMKKFGIM